MIGSKAPNHPALFSSPESATPGFLNIGVGKPPTTTVCQLIEGEYQLMQFRGDDQIQARAFPELNLTAEQVFIKSAAWH